MHILIFFAYFDKILDYFKFLCKKYLTNEFLCFILIIVNKRDPHKKLFKQKKEKFKMKKTFKILSLIMAILMLVACFAGCGAKKEEKADNKLVLGTNAAFPPYESIDDDNNFIGIDIDIAKAVADKLGMELEIKDMEFDSLLPAVQGGSVDIVFAGLTVTDERKEAVNFTNTYATGVQAIIVKENSSIASADDLNGVKIGVQSGTTGDIYCSDEFGAENVKQFSNGPLAVQALLNDQIDAVVIDNEPAKAYVAANSGLKVLDTAYAEEDYAAAIAKENKDLLKKVNDAMAELKADGTIDKIIAKYIKAE